MLHFDYRGYLKPNTNIISNISEIREVFVQNIKSEKRAAIFERYLAYSNALKNTCNHQFIQWINGSFCTQKGEPGDIDIVSFIPHTTIEASEMLFARFTYPASESEFGVDAYVVKVYPEKNRYYRRYNGDKLYWLDKFSKTKVSRIGKQYAKVFLEINY